jgi:hypothetical protein
MWWDWLSLPQQDLHLQDTCDLSWRTYHFQKVLSGKAARFEQRNILKYLSSADIAEDCTNQNLVKLV